MTQKLASNLSSLQRKVTMQSHRHHNALGYAENQDRDGFEKEFWLHLNKAVNNVERATKEKHVRCTSNCHLYCCLTLAADFFA